MAVMLDTRQGGYSSWLMKAGDCQLLHNDASYIVDVEGPLIGSVAVTTLDGCRVCSVPANST